MNFLGGNNIKMKVQSSTTDIVSNNLKRKITITFDNQKELDIFNTLIGYYPFHTMEKLRIEYGNRFPDVTTKEVQKMVNSISEVLPLKSY